MSYILEGVLTEVFQTQQMTEKFYKRDFVIEKTEHKGNRVFTETIKFQLTNDNCDLIDPYTEGEEIKVHFNIKGRKHEKDGRENYFVNLEAWRIERVSSGPAIDPEPDFIPDEIPPEEPDNLPF